MNRGADIILKIPKSGTLVRIPTYLSWNNLGMIYWSDGKTSPDYNAPVFARHPGTGELFWPRLCKEVRREPLTLELLEQGDKGPIPYPEIPLVEDFERTEESGRFPDEGLEAGFRRSFWWVANDAQRRGGSRAIPEQRFRQNLERLLALTAPKTPGREWMEIEIARELGEFDRASSLLDRVPNAEGSVVGRCFRRFLTARDSRVARIAP